MAEEQGLSIWKYALEVTDEQAVEMPQHARLLSVQAQGDALCVWALVNPTADREVRRFYVYGTGQPLPKAMQSQVYIGTAQQHGGALVWHLFAEPTLADTLRALSGF